MAMKVMSKYRVIDEQQVEHIQQERKLLQRVDHPFIVALEWAFQTQASLFLVMEFCQGGDVYETMQARPEGSRHFSEPESRFICAELVLALGHIHSMDMVFRDLKPENVLFDMQGHVRLTDFGLAKPMIRGAVSLRETVCGTPLYMSPEGVRNHQSVCKLQKSQQQLLSSDSPYAQKAQQQQQQRNALDRPPPVHPTDLSEEALLPGYANDWWMLGTLTYELMVGATPFNGAGMDALHDSILAHDVHFATATTKTDDALVEAAASATATGADADETGSQLPRATASTDAEQGLCPANVTSKGGTPCISELGQSFVRELLDKSPLTRLGADSTAQVQKHDWFGESLDWWDALERKELQPLYVPAPSDDPLAHFPERHDTFVHDDDFHAPARNVSSNGAADPFAVKLHSVNDFYFDRERARAKAKMREEALAARMVAAAGLGSVPAAGPPPQQQPAPR